MKPDECKLVIVHTNDLHSHFERMPRIAAAVARLRENRSPSEVIVIDCGDHMDRMRAETEGSRGEANVAVMNATGYDLVVPGNNEGLTFPPETLANAYRPHGRFAVLCSNLLDGATGRVPDWMEPCRILNKEGLRVGLIGVTAYFPDFYTLLGWDVRDPYETVSRLAAELRPLTDVLIVVSHLGLAHDRRMAEEIEGIDVILGGHTHHLLEEPLCVNGTVIAAAGCFGQYVGELEFRYRFDTRQLKLVAGRCYNTDRFPPCPEIVRLIERYADSSRTRLGQPIAALDRPLAIRWEKESPLGNLLASGIRRWVGAEVGIVNAGQILQGLEAGVVTKGRLLEICPSPINPCRIRLRGERIWQAAEEALLAEFTEKAIRGFGFRGKVLGTLCLDGIRVEYDPDGEPYRKIRSMAVNGRPIRLEQRYDVGTIDMFTFGIGYMSLAEGGEPEYFLPEFLRDVLEKQLRDPDEVRASAELRWIAT